MGKATVATESIYLPFESGGGHTRTCPRAIMPEEHTLTAREQLRIRLREAHRTTDSTIVGAQLTAALDA